MVSTASPDDLVITDAEGVYTDRLSLIYRPVDFPGTERDIGPAVVLVVNTGGQLLAFESLRREAERLAAGPGDGSRSYVSRSTYGHSHWGASSASVAFMLAVAGQVTGEFIVAGVRRIAMALRGIGDYSEKRPITELEARRWAPVMVSARFEDIKRPDDLAVTGLRLADSKASVRLAGPDGSSYRVELELAEGNIAFGEVERAYPAT